MIGEILFYDFVFVKKKSQNKNTNQKSKSINYLLPKGIKILEYYTDNICSIYEKKIHLYTYFFFFEFQNNFNKCSKICSKKHFSRTIMRNGWIPFVVLWKGCNYNLFVFSSTYCWFFNLDLIFPGLAIKVCCTIVDRIERVLQPQEV